MKTTWTKLEDGTWGVKIVNCPWGGGTGTGMGVTIKSRDGRKSSVILGERIKNFLIERGQPVDIYEAITEAEYNERYTWDGGKSVPKHQ